MIATDLRSTSIRHVCFNDVGDTAERRLAATAFLVEATSNEWHTLWARWCYKSAECREPLFHKWEHLGGWLVQVGEVVGRPIVVSLNWDRLDGFLVCQWQATSELVDYKMIHEWLDRHFTAKTKDGRHAQCDAANFHSLVIEFDSQKSASKPLSPRG